MAASIGSLDRRPRSNYYYANRAIFGIGGVCGDKTKKKKTAASLLGSFFSRSTYYNIKGQNLFFPVSRWFWAGKRKNRSNGNKLERPARFQCLIFKNEM